MRFFQLLLILIETLDPQCKIVGVLIQTLVGYQKSELRFLINDPRQIGVRSCSSRVNNCALVCCLLVVLAVGALFWCSLVSL